MLAVSELKASRRRRGLLRFLVEESLVGRSDRLKGFSIAVAVFGRDETFDPQMDPVVRLEARRLRRDLDSYYVGAGRHDPIRIAIPKGGYAPSFEWQAEETRSAEPPERTEDERTVPVVALPAAAARPKGPVLPGQLDLMAAFGAALLLAALVWVGFHFAALERTDLARGPAVIVLPFESLSDNDDDGFLATGMTQELITDLMRFDDFRLFSIPASVGQDGNADPVDIARDLDVAYVVKGSVRSDHATTHVNVQLFQADTGEVLWSEALDRPMTSGAMLGLQEELAASIAVVLGQPNGVVNRIAAEPLSRQSVASSGPASVSLRRE